MTIKKLIPVLALTSAVAFTLPSCKSKVPDADVKSKVESVVIPGVTVDVKDGVVTLSGNVNSDADKAAVADAIAKLDKDAGVKSVTNNLMVVAAAAPVINADDAALSAKVTDAIKDYPTVQATVSGGVITVTGEVAKAKVTNLKMALDNLKPKKTDMSALTVK